MRKIASHYIMAQQLVRFHYLTMEDGLFVSLCPLEQEEAGIEFRNGLLWIVRNEAGALPWEKWISRYPDLLFREVIDKIKPEESFSPGDPVIVFHFPDLTLPASEFRTDHSGCNPHIQRL